MKKSIILLCILLVFIILGGIFFMTKNKPDNSISENSNTSILDLPTNNDEERSIEKVKMTIKEGTLTSSNATIIIIDNNEKPYVYSKWFRIDKKENEDWKEVKPSNDDYNFIAVAYNVDKTGKLESIVDWSELYGVLEEGEYRLVKNVYDTDGNEIYFSTEFSIRKTNNNVSENLNTPILNLPTNNNEERSIEKVKMTIKEGTLTSSNATIIIIDNNEKPYVYSKWFRIDKKENKDWKEIKPSNDNYNFIAVAYNVDKTGKLESIVDWSELYGALGKGEYRLVKNVYDSSGNEIYFSTEFSI